MTCITKITRQITLDRWSETQLISNDDQGPILIILAIHSHQKNNNTFLQLKKMHTILQTNYESHLYEHV